MSRLLLVRHGETEWSAGGRHTGRTDVPLTARGEEQARGLRSTLSSYRPAQAFVSPRLRTRRTAELAGVQAQTLDDLAEWDYGDYEGLTSDEIREIDPLWTVWTAASPGGESPAAVVARAERVLATVVPLLVDGDVLLVSHGHFSRVLATTRLGLPLTAAPVLLVATASLCVLGEDRGQPVIVHWNLPNPHGAE